MATTGERFERAVSIMARLRGPGGCPWDREQTFDTIKPYALEEVYEVLEAIDARDWDELPGELGDLLLQVLFYSEIAAEENRFSIDHEQCVVPGVLVPDMGDDRKAQRPGVQLLGRGGAAHASGAFLAGPTGDPASLLPGAAGKLGADLDGDRGDIGRFARLTHRSRPHSLALADIRVGRAFFLRPTDRLRRRQYPLPLVPPAAVRPLKDHGPQGGVFRRAPRQRRVPPGQVLEV